MMMCCSSIQVQVALSCMVCVGATFWWWWWRRYHTSIANTIRSEPHHGDDDAGCNDPNCLRCHPSSQRHTRAFRTNAMLLRRLVKLEPQLFEGMRPEILDAIDCIILERRRRKNSMMVEGRQRWLHIIGESSQPLLLFIRIISDTIQQLFSIMSKRGRNSTSLSPDSTMIVSGGSSGSAIATTTTPQLSPQPGQHPTVFFLPGLEATPLHDCITCPSINCPCSRLWKKYEEEMTHNIQPSIRGKTPVSKIKCPPVRTSIGGDIEALKNGCDVIRRELLDFLFLNGSSGNQEDPFQPFDPKVYTHASSIVSRDGMAKVDDERRRNQHQLHRHQPEWSSIYLYHRGILQSNLCRKHFPQTLHILETLSHRMAGKCGFGSVYFSKLGRNTKVKEHCGPTNVRWRCHLPLIVPPPPRNEKRRSRLRVGLADVNENFVGWEEGKPILFDDSFLHSAIHHGDDGIGDDGIGDDVAVDDDVIGGANDVDDHINSSSSSKMSGARIVLIADFWHPSLSESDRTAVGVLYPPGT